MAPEARSSEDSAGGIEARLPDADGSQTKGVAGRGRERECQVWHYTLYGQQASAPISAAQLKQLAVGGDLKPTDLIWRDSMTDWVPASSIEGIFTSGKPEWLRMMDEGRLSHPLGSPRMT